MQKSRNKLLKKSDFFIFFLLSHTKLLTSSPTKAVTELLYIQNSITFIVGPFSQFWLQTAVQKQRLLVAVVLWSSNMTLFWGITQKVKVQTCLLRMCSSHTNSSYALKRANKQESKWFSLKTIKGLEMACHTPPLKKLRNKRKYHSVPSLC